MISCGLEDLRHYFSPALDELEDKTLIPLFHVVLQGFFESIWTCHRVRASELQLEVQHANIAALSNVILARDYRVSFKGSNAADMRNRFLQFLKCQNLDLLRAKVKNDLENVNPHLLPEETSRFFLGRSSEEDEDCSVFA